MNFVLDNWYLFLVAIASATALFWPLISGGSMGALTISEAVALINKEKAVVVDVRTPEEFAAGSIVGAKNLPLAELADKLPAVSKNKELPLVLICATGVKSQRAVAAAKRLGFARAQSMAGGMAAWLAASMPVHKA